MTETKLKSCGRIVSERKKSFGKSLCALHNMDKEIGYFMLKVFALSSRDVICQHMHAAVNKFIKTYLHEYSLCSLMLKLQ